MVDPRWNAGAGRNADRGNRTRIAGRDRASVSVLEMIEVFERINFGSGADETWKTLEEKRRPRFHFVIVDYLCERISGVPVAGGDVTDVAWADENNLEKFGLTPTATRVIRKAFSLARARK